MQHLGWGFVFIGVVLTLLGGVLLLAPSIPWLGKLPGDIAIEKPGLRVYFPITTCVLLSILLTGLMWLVRFFWR